MLDFIKNNPITSILAAYLIIISVISVIVCIYDKAISKTGRVSLRTPEAKLFSLSAMGGALAMFACMLIIRHKTKHLRFMLGIPLIILIQAAIIGVLFYFGVLTFNL